ncbi:hypothetical protein RHMOL_Rhmol12G0060400 [Rhododendron molle]|uniref:Uncharacterized protein n=1 Tax=Rhododendron molle TaxID=49168 RepID=A0ACC0LFA6_RHOML|nr:hypothetical protein RHMOL_Rhmol12G0060400 [Rhododendron molle]
MSESSIPSFAPTPVQSLEELDHLERSTKKVKSSLLEGVPLDPSALMETQESPVADIHSPEIVMEIKGPDSKHPSQEVSMENRDEAPRSPSKLNPAKSFAGVLMNNKSSSLSEEEIARRFAEFPDSDEEDEMESDGPPPSYKISNQNHLPQRTPKADKGNLERVSDH